MSARALPSWAKASSLCIVAAVACGGLAFGAKLMLIGRCGTDVPYWDEWDAMGGAILIPRANNDLHVANFFMHQNEHRIVLTRVLSYLLAIWNNQWDGMLEMTVNAGIHAGVCVALAMLARRFVSGVSFAVVALITTVLFCADFDWENTLQGFQSQFYFLEWGALGMFILCAPSVPLSRRWWAGWLCGFASLGAMASGFLAAAAVLALIVLRAVIDRRLDRRVATAGAFLAAICVVGVLSSTHISYHDRYKAHSPFEWLSGVEKLLSWPTPDWPAAFLVVQAPIFVLLVKRIRSRSLGGDELVLMALAFWGWLQIAALSYGRVNYGLNTPRYTDVLAIGVYVSGVALFILFGEGGRRFLLGCFAAAWISLFAVGVWKQDHNARIGVLTELPTVKSAERRHIKAFLDGGRPNELETAPTNELPYPVPERLGELLSDQGIKSMLPIGVRSPLGLFADQESNGFAAADSGHLPLGLENKAWFAATGPAKFVSQNFQAGDLPYFHVSFCGSPDLDGTVIHLESLDGDESGPNNPLSPDHWQAVDFSVSRDAPSRLVVEIPKGNHWFAFTEPVELGRLSWANRWLLRRAAWIAWLSGTLLAATLIAIAAFPSQALHPKRTMP